MSTLSIEHKRTNRRFGKSAAISFFIASVQEYFSPLYLSWKHADSLKKERNSLLNSKKALSVIQEAICFNQSGLIQFVYLMAEKHKDIKDEYRDNPHYSKALENKVRTLVYYLNQEFHKNIFHNFAILHSYYSNRSNNDPRICIKGSFNTHHRDVVVSIFRDAEVAYQSDSEISENTGFSSVAKNGKYFICNNLPSAAAKGQYTNPRLDSAKIRNAISKGRASDVSNYWREYWRDFDTNSDAKSFYKSTLIIPMTLWNNKLSQEFREKINAPEIGRTIFGFLCLDNVDEDYFIEDDVRIGYVFADLMSQYIFHRSVYTDLSKTFGKVINALRPTVNIMPERMVLSENWESACSHIDINSKLKLEESRNNTLFGIDEELMDYLGKNVHVHTAANQTAEGGI